MARAIVSYTKTVLEKVSFNADLFRTELEKALKRLLPHEIQELKFWVLRQFKDEPQLQSCLIKVRDL